MSDTISFLSPSDFESGRYPFPGFRLRADSLTINGTELNDVTFDAYYAANMGLVLEYAVNDQIGLIGMSKLIEISGQGFPEPVELFAINCSLTLGANAGTKMVFIPQNSILLVQFSPKATLVEAVIVNGPEPWPPKAGLDICHGDYRIFLKEFSSTSDCRKQERLLKRDYIATGTVTIQRIDGKEFDPETAFQEICHLHRFLTFVKGAYCGIGNIIGRKQGDTVAFAYLGFLRTDQFATATGWCDRVDFKSLPRICKLYSKAVSVEADRELIQTTIEFYRASNVIRESSLEVAVVASHAALETIIPHLLKKAEVELPPKENCFHDKLRAAANKVVKLTVDPIPPLLKKRLDAEPTLKDVFELLPIFRNRIVHQDKPFEYTGEELINVWNMLQWLCEIFLFSLLQYQGDMNDRRQYQGLRGAGIGPVPINDISAQEN